MKNQYTNSQTSIIKQKYTKLYRRVAKALATGLFIRYAEHKKQSIIKRLKRYERRLVKWGLGIASVSSLFLSPFATMAQAPDYCSDEFKVNTETMDSQVFPTMAMDDDGDYVVAWQSGEQDGAGYGIFAQLFNNAGEAQGSEFQVNTHITDDQELPTVAMDSDGDFVVAWDSAYQDGSGYGVYAQLFNNAGEAEGSEFRVNTDTISSQMQPIAAMDSDGGFVIIWLNSIQGSFEVYAQRYNKFGVQQGGEFRVNTDTEGYCNHHAIAMDSDGNFVVAWSIHLPGNWPVGHIYARRFNKLGETQGAEFFVDTFAPESHQGIVMEMDNNGDFVLAWENNSVDSVGIYGKSYTNLGVEKGGGFKISSYNNNNISKQESPAIAMDNDGDFVVTWDSYKQNGADHDIYAQRFNNLGDTVGGEFLVNSKTTNTQRWPTVGMDGDGDFTVAWTSYWQEGEYTEIYAQCFSKTVGTPITAVGEQAALALVPNPVRGNTFTLYHPSVYKEGQLSIFDVTGRLLQSQTLSGGETAVNIGDLPGGLYFLWVDLDGLRSAERLVVE